MKIRRLAFNLNGCTITANQSNQSTTFQSPNTFQLTLIIDEKYTNSDKPAHFPLVSNDTQHVSNPPFPYIKTAKL
ncbi:hypothetical protein JTE90_020320 [Oedothorax gibbosus]|uniref:Uncharacterized protein n=1 Tax=Oedothorax gibbosus TaxID=931172 RepID=A0AAV6VN10_9ARAC|nr:hypothetical protein JTE90_020320 [Oedothorax gibbosus]